MVPDTFDFTLYDIYNVTGYSDLYNSFNYYNYAWVDQYYWNYETGMRRFRNYGPRGYINLSVTTLKYYQSGGAYGDYYFTVQSDVDWTIDVDTSEISYLSFSPSYGYAGTTEVYCYVESSNNNSFPALSSNTIRNTEYTVYAYLTVCQDGWYNACDYY